MYTILVILIILASLFMCLVVLIQESKGGGLAADYASGNTLLGAPKTTDIIQKLTAGLAIAMVLLCVISTAFLPEVKAVDSVLKHSLVLDRCFFARHTFCQPLLIPLK